MMAPQYAMVVVQAAAAALALAAVMTLTSCGANSITAPSTPVATPTRIIAVSGNLAFGTLLVGATATVTLTITNSGNATLTVSSITQPEGLTASWTTGTIAAGGSQNVTIGLSPTSAGKLDGVITVNSDQTSGSNAISTTASVFPNLNGSWIGRQTTALAESSSDCPISWVVAGQLASYFSGTWQTSGENCGQGGTLTGFVSVTNALSGLSLVVTGSPSPCLRVKGDGLFQGVLADATATVQESDTIRCPGVEDISRSVTLSMSKQ
jgi:Abnormal spindle-like microcephaly-assoc'd, ASPM-SPD-2-Hydin